MKNKIIWLIGKKFPKFCLWYYNKTGKWLWGIIPFIQISQKINPELIKEEKWFNEGEFDSMMKQIFKFKR